MSLIKNKKAQAGLLMLIIACGVWLVLEITPQRDYGEAVVTEKKAENKETIKGTKYSTQDLDAKDNNYKSLGFRSKQSNSILSDKELLTGNKKQEVTSIGQRDRLKALRIGLDLTKQVLPIQTALGDETEGFDITRRQKRESVYDLTLYGMTEEDLEFAYEFIENGIPPVGMSLGEYNWLADELFTSLRSQENLPPDLTQKLISNLEGNGNPVLRDYASQHLGHFHEEGGSGGEAELLQIEEALLEATYQTEGTTAGSALIALDSAETDGRLLSKFDLDKRSYEILKQHNYTNEVKAAALKILQKNDNWKDYDLAEVASEIAEIYQNKLPK